MEMFGDETEFTDMDMIQKVVDMFERRPRLQRIVKFGLLGLEYEHERDDTDEEDYEIDNWVQDHHGFRGYPGLAGDMSSGRGFRMNPNQAPIHYYSGANVNIQAKESDAERNARLLEVMEKREEKAYKKQLKKQNQKIKKQLEKETQSPLKTKEDNKDLQQSKAEGSKPVDEKSKDDPAKEAGSSEAESSDEDSDAKADSFESEELDMTSTFVTKAALIAKRQLEQKPKPERREQKKSPVKDCRTVPDKPNEEPKLVKKPEQASAVHSIPTFEDNIKICTELAVIGNRFASSGDFNMAVKYFTDAIRYNPTEFKLFGNRSFCFEKMQEYEKALTDAELCVNMCPGWVKGLFRKGRALAGLKRYEEAAQSFSEVLKLDGSYSEAAQELMRVQITQLMEYGFTREQSSNALIIHGTVAKAQEVLSKLNRGPGAFQNAALPPAQVMNVSGLSPVLSANTKRAAPPPQSQDAAYASLRKYVLGPAQNMSNVQSQRRPTTDQPMKVGAESGQRTPELFPVWVGNLNYPVPEAVITNLFSKAGVVYSVKVLSYKRCAFVNFTKQEHCDEAIRRFHGFELDGMKIAVRYPDRIPPNLGIARSAHAWQYTFGNRRPVPPHRVDYNN